MTILDTYIPCTYPMAIESIAAMNRANAAKNEPPAPPFGRRLRAVK
jgi:hypothetical protein